MTLCVDTFDLHSFRRVLFLLGDTHRCEAIYCVVVVVVVFSSLLLLKSFDYFKFMELCMVHETKEQIICSGKF